MRKTSEECERCNSYSHLMNDLERHMVKTHKIMVKQEVHQLSPVAPKAGGGLEI